MKSTDINDVLSLWKPSAHTPIDSSLIELCHSEFFRQYQIFTEQFLFVLDHASMKYLYISDNAWEALGLPVEEMMEKGIACVAQRFHPDDVEKLGMISSLLNDKLKTLTADEVLECRLTFDYRMLLGDNQYHRLLQHNIPLTVDKGRSIGHALVLITDISAYKGRDYCGYKLVHYRSGGPVTLLQGVAGNEASVSISKRELDVIRLTADGLTEKEIADRLSVSVQTVKTHRRNILRKTGVANSAEMVKWSMANLLL